MTREELLAIIEQTRRENWEKLNLKILLPMVALGGEHFWDEKTIEKWVFKMN